MLATICSYENWFGPYHPQTLLLTAQAGIACWQAGETRLARVLLERAIRDLGRISLGQTWGEDHGLRLQALVALRDLFEAQRDYERAAAAQKELMACQARRLGDEHPETVAARADLARLAFEGLSHRAAL